MVGEALLRDLVFTPVRREVGWGRAAHGWSRTDSSLIGPQVWERCFQSKGSSSDVLVTVHFDPHTRVIQTLYAACMSERDEAPRIPAHVRKEAHAFAQDLLAD
jgi:hypothetical protein